MSQRSKILALLKRGETITADEAKRWFGCERLASRIYRLRHKYGYSNIKSPMIEVGNGKRVARYELPQEEGQLELNLRGGSYEQRPLQTKPPTQDAGSD